MSCIFWHFGFLPHIHDLLNQDPQRLSAPCCTWQACTQRGSPPASPASTSPLSSATASSPARLAPCWHGSTTASLPSSALTRSYNIPSKLCQWLLSSLVALDNHFPQSFYYLCWHLNASELSMKQKQTI